MNMQLGPVIAQMGGGSVEVQTINHTGSSVTTVSLPAGWTQAHVAFQGTLRSAQGTVTVLGFVTASADSYIPLKSGTAIGASRAVVSSTASNLRTVPTTVAGTITLIKLS